MWRLMPGFVAYIAERLVRPNLGKNSQAVDFQRNSFYGIQPLSNLYCSSQSWVTARFLSQPLLLVPLSGTSNIYLSRYNLYSSNHCLRIPISPHFWPSGLTIISIYIHDSGPFLLIFVLLPFIHPPILSSVYWLHVPEQCLKSNRLTFPHARISGTLSSVSPLSVMLIISQRDIPQNSKKVCCRLSFSDLKSRS